MKKIVAVILIMVLCFTIITPKSVNAAVTISKAKATMEVDSTLKLYVSGTNSTVTWKTSKKAVATISTAGTITAKAEGSATITATVSGKNYTCAVTIVNSNKKLTAKSVYKLGDTWTVDGLWSLTFNAVTTTDDRNQFSDKTPDQVIILDYSYVNIGYKGDIMDLYISSSDMKIIDEKGEVSTSYPALTTKSPQETPVGAKCSGAQEAIGLDNESSKITVYVEIYDEDYKKHTATFELVVD